MLILFQFVSALFVLLVLLNIFATVRKRDLSSRGGVLWAVLWVLTLLIVLFPNIATHIAQVFGIGRGSDVVIYGAVALLFGVSFSLHVKLSRIERSLTKVVREDALFKLEEKR